jgi:hypothetical protein
MKSSSTHFVSIGSAHITARTNGVRACRRPSVPLPLLWTQHRKHNCKCVCAYVNGCPVLAEGLDVMLKTSARNCSVSVRWTKQRTRIQPVGHFARGSNPSLSAWLTGCKVKSWDQVAVCQYRFSSDSAVLKNWAWLLLGHVTSAGWHWG